MVVDIAGAVVAAAMVVAGSAAALVAGGEMLVGNATVASIATGTVGMAVAEGVADVLAIPVYGVVAAAGVLAAKPKDALQQTSRTRRIQSLFDGLGGHHRGGTPYQYCKCRGSS